MLPCETLKAKIWRWARWHVLHVVCLLAVALQAEAERSPVDEAALELVGTELASMIQAHEHERSSLQEQVHAQHWHWQAEAAQS